jgi:hypothetical protein
MFLPVASQKNNPNTTINARTDAGIDQPSEYPGTTPEKSGQLAVKLKNILLM